MEGGELARDEFMSHIESVTREMVDRIKNGELPEEAFSTLRTPCPKCGGVIKETYKKFECQGCDYTLWKVVASRQWEPEEMETLLRERVVGPVQGFRSKMGRPFAAMVKLNADHLPEFDFGQGSDSDSEDVDFSGQEALGPCSKCGANVFEHGMSYVCEKSLGPAKICDFRSGKIILQQEIARGQMQKLLATGKTDLLKGFVSSRTKRKFSAYLVRGADGKVGFEFEVRAPRAKKPAAVGKSEEPAEVVESTAAPAKLKPAAKKRAASKR
jgi:DNA topoisomerase-3